MKLLPTETQMMAVERFPGLLPPIPENIPDELKARRHWIVWETEYDPEIDKWTKVPKCPARTKVTASKNNPSHFGTFDEAYQAYLASNHLGGVGYVVMEQDNLTFFDLDKCVRNGVIDDQAQAVIDDVCSYTELSPSGKGIRIIAIGKLPGRQINNHALGRELYDGQKNSFLTITGHSVTDQPDIVDAQKEIDIYYSQWKTSGAGEKSTIVFTNEFHDDIDISRIGSRTLNLLQGEGWKAYPSRSEVLMGVCKDLLRYGYSTDEILSICTDDNLFISQIANSRRPNNRESQRLWIANYTLSKALAEYQFEEANKVYLDDILIKAPGISKAAQANGPRSFPVPVLNELAEWMETLDERPTRMITLQGVLALTAVLAGRLYKSANSNDSSLFLMTLAPTGYGKGYPAKAIKSLFTHADLTNLIKGAGNTSASAVFSALRESPCHIQISDEIGKQYQAARKQSNGMLAEAFAMLTSAYSETDSTLLPRNFSTETLTATQLASRGKRFIIHPSITLFSFATFEQVFNALTHDDIDDGFLNRQIIVNVDEAQLPERERQFAKPPAHLIEWARSMRLPTRGSTGNLSGVDAAFDLIPDYKVVGICNEAKALFKAFKVEAREYSGDRLKMAIRWNENALRMSTGLAVADNAECPVISADIAQWCIDYVRFHGVRMFDLVESHIADNDVHRLRNQVLKAVQTAGAGGITYGKFAAFCRLWKGATLQQRDGVLESLKREDLIVEVLPPVKAGRGRKAVQPIYFDRQVISPEDDETAD